MQRSSSNVDEIIANYDYRTNSSYEASHLTPIKRPNRDRSPFDTMSDAIPLPPLSRTTSQCSANSMASTAFLLDQHRHPSAVKSTSGFHWHPFHSRKEKYSGDSDFDAEKLSPVDDSGGGGRDGGGGRGGNESDKPVMKPWEGWRLVLMESCKFHILDQYLPSARTLTWLHRVQSFACVLARVGEPQFDRP